MVLFFNVYFGAGATFSTVNQEVAGKEESIDPMKVNKEAAGNVERYRRSMEKERGMFVETSHRAIRRRGVGDGRKLRRKWPVDNVSGNSKG
jgi:hypothetical protein